MPKRAEHTGAGIQPQALLWRDKSAAIAKPAVLLLQQPGSMIVAQQNLDSQP